MMYVLHWNTLMCSLYSIYEKIPLMNQFTGCNELQCWCFLHGSSEPFLNKHIRKCCNSRQFLSFTLLLYYILSLPNFCTASIFPRCLGMVFPALTTWMANLRLLLLLSFVISIYCMYVNCVVCCRYASYPHGLPLVQAQLHDRRDTTV